MWVTLVILGCFFTSSWSLQHSCESELGEWGDPGDGGPESLPGFQSVIVTVFSEAAGPEVSGSGVLDQ